MTGISLIGGRGVSPLPLPFADRRLELHDVKERGRHSAPALGTQQERTQSANGSRTRIVSSRSGLVESIDTGAWISSSMRRMYLIAVAGRSAQERAPRVLSPQPSSVS